MKKLSFSIELPESNEKEKLEAPFTQQEMEQLNGYLSQTEELCKTRLIKSGLDARIKVNWNVDEGFKIESTLPPEDDLLAILHRLRPFILQEEFASFDRVIRLIGKKFRHKLFRKVLKDYRFLYEGKQIESTFTITSNEMVINSEKTMMDWLNSHEYHRDQDKKKKLEPIFEILSHEGTKAIFVMLIIDKIKAILKLSDLIKLITGSEEVHTINYNQPMAKRLPSKPINGTENTSALN